MNASHRRCLAGGNAGDCRQHVAGTGLQSVRHRVTGILDTEIPGQQIRAGDKVGLFYCSANRDESVFDEPGTFDLGRSPNPHLGFGGGGPHFCLGSQLAKAELRNLFRELLTRLNHVEFGEPDLLYSGFVHGIKRLPAHVR
jgi:cytochrome P450